MAKLFNLARMTTSTTGTGTITLGSAASGYISFSAAGVADGDIVAYGIADGANSECGTGTYTANGTTLTRTVTTSTNSNNAISLSGNAQVFIIARSQDLITAPLNPGGRLTLVSGTPVMTINETAKTTIYYTQYKGSYVPLWDGKSWAPWKFTEQSVTLDTTNVVGANNYDLFMFNNAGTPTLGYGPAWTNIATRSAAISRQDGLWTNTASITLRTNSTTTFSVGAGQALYVGSFFATANGQTGFTYLVSGSGGGTSNAALYNAYNRILVNLRNSDTGQWTNSGSVWGVINAASFSDNINFLDGLGESSILAIHVAWIQTAAGGCGIGINLNSTSGTPSCASGGTTNSTNQGATCTGIFEPTLGLNTVYPMEINFGGGTFPTTFGSTALHGQCLSVSVEM